MYVVILKLICETVTFKLLAIVLSAGKYMFVVNGDKNDPHEAARMMNLFSHRVNVE